MGLLYCIVLYCIVLYWYCIALHGIVLCCAAEVPIWLRGSRVAFARVLHYIIQW